MLACYAAAPLPDVVREFPKAGFISISENQRRQLPGAKWIGTIQHGLPWGLFRLPGALDGGKGPEDAIRIAPIVGMPLRIAAKIPKAETGYFEKQLQPHIDGETVVLIGRS